MSYYARANGTRILLNATDIENAKSEADEWITYCQSDLYLDNGDREHPVLHRTWYGVKFDPETDGCDGAEIIDFGDNGFYGPWEGD